MASERTTLNHNENDSKNTRMDIVKSMELMDFRKDELMHIGRYLNAGQTAIDLSKRLGRPLKILDIGCGEMYTMRTLYKSFVCVKSDVVKSYLGLDIDRPMLERTADQFQTVVKAMRARLVPVDLTIDPKLKLKDNSVDLIFCFEMIEHIKPEFVTPILEEAHRVLSKKGVMLLSTPNSNGSNKNLPKDHVYEWSYEELSEAVKSIGFEVESATGTCINPSKIPAKVWNRVDVNSVYSTFGRRTAMSCVALGPMFPVEYSKNMLFTLKKGGQNE